MKSISKVSMKRQLLTAFLILFSVFAAANLITGLLIIHYTSEEQAKKTLDQNLEVHRKSLEEWFHSKSDYIESLSTLQSFKKQENVASIRQNLAAVGKLNLSFQQLYYISGEGIAEAVTSGEPGADFSQSPLFATAREGRPFVTGFLDGGYGETGSIMFVSPIMDGEEFKGMVAGTVNRSTIMLTLASYRFGDTGHMYLMDGKGSLLSANPDLVRPDSHPLFGYARDQVPASGFYRTGDGEEAYGGYLLLSDGRFKLLAEIRRSEIMEPVYRTMATFAAFFTVIFLLCMGGLLWFAKRMGVTLRLLSESALAVMRGDYGYAMEARKGMFRSSETDGIMAAFSEMTATVSRQMEELHYMNEQWKDSEERYRTIIESSPDGILIQSEGRIALINPAGARMLGAESPAQLIGLDAMSIVHPSSLAQVQMQIRDVMDTQGTMPAEERWYVRLDGGTVKVETTAAFIQLNGQRSIMVVFRDIMERLRLEAAIQESEELHRFIAENSTDMIARVDSGLIYHYVSQACSHLLGYDPSEMTGRSVMEFVHPDYQAELRSLLDRMSCSDPEAPVDTLTLRYRFIRKDGKAIWLETSARMVRNANGNLLEVVAVSRDISDRVAMEQELIDRNTRITDILSSITDAFFALDKEWRFTYVNSTAEQVLGKPKEALIGKVIWEELPRVKDTRVSIEYERAVREQVSVMVEEYYPFMEAWYETRAYPRKDGLSVYIRDINARKELEEELRVNQEYLIQVLETIPSAIMLINPEGRFTFANKKAEELFGLPRGSIVLRYYDDPSWKLYTLEGEPYPRERLPYAQVSRTLEPAYGVELLYEASDGTMRVYSSNSTPMLGPKGELSSVLISVTDITESKRLEQELHKLSTMDGLTGIPNRRHFNEVLNREWQRAARFSKPLSMIMLDVDYFKSYNDTYGHQAGDECLKAVASILNEVVKRGGDMVFRYGGEEFAVILPDTDELGAVHVAEQIRKAVEDRTIPHKSSPNRVLTASLGIAEVIPTPLSGPESLIAKADRALYRAKQKGRNQVQSDR